MKLFFLFLSPPPLQSLESNCSYFNMVSFHKKGIPSISLLRFIEALFKLCCIDEVATGTLSIFTLSQIVYFYVLKVIQKSKLMMVRVIKILRCLTPPSIIPGILLSPLLNTTSPITLHLSPPPPPLCCHCPTHLSRLAVYPLLLLMSPATL